MQVNTSKYYESRPKHPDRAIQYKKKKLKGGWGGCKRKILTSFKINAESSDTFLLLLTLFTQGKNVKC